MGIRPENLRPLPTATAPHVPPAAPHVALTVNSSAVGAAPAAVVGESASVCATEAGPAVVAENRMRPGAHVRVTGLPTRPDVDGALGVLLEWLPQEGRWRVRLDVPQGHKSCCGR